MRSILTILCFIACLLFAAWFVDQALHRTHPPLMSEPPRLYSNQARDDLRLYFTQAIDQAKKSVTLSIYTITDPMIISSLRKKAKEGIPVTVITDAKTAAGLKEKLGHEVKIDYRFLKGIMHRKILVIDGELAWIGSANMTTESLRMHGNLVVGIADPQVARYLEENMFNAADPYRTFNFQGQEVDISFQPEDREEVYRIERLIRSAKKSLKIAMFTWTNKDLAQAVIDVRKKGIDVQVVMDRQQANGASGKIAALLYKRDIPVRLSTGPGLLHYKFALIDDKTLISGSANWTRAAFNQNEESVIIIHDLNEEQQKQMEKLWKVIQLESTPAKFR
jgi:phosphatidylserine/phosphatidylglycerophosphate/cardiolipin synthase-like enzyme